MKCYYEVLGCEQNVEGDSLKKAYYKLSLKWHPDKNPGRTEEVTPIYQEIMEAYKVLSDPQERAWYDKHRDRILQGGMGKGGGDFKEERLDVYAYFTASCFSGFGDDVKSFYTVYRGVFDLLAEEEYRGMVEKTSECELPTFGRSDSSYDEVVGPFYAVWECFMSRKTYAWVEQYNPRDGESRFARRAMEAENKKLRDTARKERQDEIRALVSFVKKRDRRVVIHREALAQHAAEAEARTLKKTQQARQRAAQSLQNEMEIGQAEWTDMGAMESELAKLEAQWTQDKPSDVTEVPERDPGSENEEEFDDGLFCPACNKVFRSDQAFANHENSKKHKTRVAILREHLLADDADLLGDDEPDSVTNDIAENVQIPIAKSQPVNEVKSKRAKKNRRRQKRLEDEDDEPDVEIAPVESTEIDVDVSIPEPISSETVATSASNQNGEVTKPDACDGKSKSAKGSHSCTICGVDCETRNKLFEHIRSTGHAALKTVSGKPDVLVEEETGKKKKKGGKKR